MTSGAMPSPIARSTRLKSKWPPAWPTSKITPRSLALRTSGKSFALVVDDRRLLRRVAVRDDIAGTQRIGDLIHADRRVADMHHDRRARRLAGLDRQAQRFAAVLADGFLVQAHFDTDADVAVIADRLRSAVGIREIRG